MENHIVLPYLNYCSLVWSGASLSNLNRLQVLQKKAIRLCSNAHYLAHTAPLFKGLNTLTLSDNVSLKVGIFMFKYFKGILPEIFYHCLYLNNTIHNFDTRNKHTIVLPYCRLSIKQKHSILYIKVPNSGMLLIKFLKTWIHQIVLRLSTKNFLSVPTEYATWPVLHSCFCFFSFSFVLLVSLLCMFYVKKNICTW